MNTRVFVGSTAPFWFSRARFSWLCALAIVAAGCSVEPSYRTEVTGNGQGGVDVKKVARDSSPTDPSASFAPPSPSAPAPATSSSPAPLDQRISDMELRMQQMNKDLEELKREKAAQDLLTKP